jgi:hypothetical protein
MAIMTGGVESSDPAVAGSPGEIVWGNEGERVTRLKRLKG